MNPEHHIDALRRVLPTIATDAVRDALLEFLMTGQSPPLSECSDMMPGVDRLHERYVVHFLSKLTSPAGVLSLDECIKGMLQDLPTHDTHDPRAPY